MNPDPHFIEILDHEQSSEDKSAPFTMHAIVLEMQGPDAKITTVVSVTNDYEDGLAWVNEMNAMYQSLVRKRQQLSRARQEWRDKHPMPVVQPTLLPVPVPPTDRAPTLEEREEKHRINNENFLRTLAAREPQRQWLRQEEQFMQAWLNEHLTPQERELHASANENVWTIAPVPWHKA